MEKKQRISSSNGEGVGEAEGCWEGLSPEILALIFVRIPAHEMVKSVPLVCQSWREVVAGPYCWSEIDIEQWCRRINRSDVIDSAVRRLVRRSKGTVRSLSAYKLGDAAFAFVAIAGKCLKVLKIPMSHVTDSMVGKHGASLANLTVLDISYCLKITPKGLGALGKHCKALVRLRRNMPPPEFQSGLHAVDEGEALAVADTMPALRHLELAYGSFTDVGLDAIVTKCKSLRHLDIQGCWNVNMGGDIETKCERITVFRGPWDDEYDDANSSGSGENETDDDEEEDSSSNYSD